MSRAHGNNGLSPNQAANMVKIVQALRDLSAPNNSFALTTREIDQLQNAFEVNTQGTSRSEWDANTKEAEQLLKDLDSIADMLGAEGKTGDVDDGDEQEGSGGTQEGGKYAPVMKIPRQRRLQTFVMSLFLFFTAVPLCLWLTGILLLFPLTTPFMIAHLIYIFMVPLKHPLPRRSWWTKSILWKIYRDYFPLRLQVAPEVQKAVDPTKNYLFCYHPHGIHGFGAMINFGSEANHVSEKFPGMTFHVQTLAVNFSVPFFRYFCIWGGAGDASAKCIRKTLTSGPGQSAVLVVGGAKEATLSAPKTNDLVLEDRKGFVKLALSTGASLVPVFGFGETNVYENLAETHPKLERFLEKTRRFLKLPFSLPLFSGRGYFNYTAGVLPHRRPIITVVGMPIDLPKIEKPTQEEIDEWHAKYVQALMELYQENKSVYDLMAKSGVQLKK